MPLAEYKCVGFWAVDVPPSPKFQLHDVGEPVELSVKVTSNGAVPDVGIPVKLATGTTPPELTEM